VSTLGLAVKLLPVLGGHRAPLSLVFVDRDDAFEERTRGVASIEPASPSSR
jgi:hypothetical protein